MRAAGGRSGYLNELEAFLGFLRKVWGLLAGISVFFPLSNAVVGVIPLGAYGDVGVYDKIPPALVSTLATVVTLFVVLATFARRRRFARPDARSFALRLAWRSLGGALACLAAYLVLHQVYAEWAWDRWQWGSGDPRKLLAELPLATLYVAFFCLLTRAFMLLGMVEFYAGQAAGPDTEGPA